MQNCAPILGTRYLEVYWTTTFLDRPRASDKICISESVGNLRLLSLFIEFPFMQASKFSRGAYTAQWLVQPFSSFPFLPILSMLKFSWPQVLTLVQPSGYARKNRPPPYVQQPASPLRIRDVYRWRRLWVEAELQVQAQAWKWTGDWVHGVVVRLFFFFWCFLIFVPFQVIII